MRSLRLVAATLVAILATSPVHADEPSTPRLELSLEQALALSLGNNPELAVRRVAPRRAAAEVTRQKGVFDPILSLFAGIDRDHRPPGPVQLGTFRNSLAGDARLSGMLPSGTLYDVSYGTTRVETDSQFSFAPLASTAQLQLQVRQPLLRNFGRDIPSTGITLARGSERIASHELRRQTELTLAATVDAYWRLVRAHKSLAVARESLDLAQRLVERTQARVAAGDLPSIELTQARASVAAREEAVILGEAEVGNANDALARLVVLDRREVFGVSLLPTDDPAMPLATFTAAAALEEALRRRPDLAAARGAVQNAEAALRLAENQRRPDLSAVGTVGVAGLDDRWPGSQRELVTEVDDQYRWSVGLVLSVPLGNRAADGAYQQARLALEQARLAQRSLELQVTEDVRSALRDLEAAARRIEATRRASELAREQLAAGEKRMETGLSTAFEVLRLQTDLATAQNAEIAAAVSYRTSVVRVHLATGSLLGRVVDG